MQRVVRLSCVRYCSVLATVRGVAELEATVELVAPDGTSSGRLPVDLAPGPQEPGEPTDPLELTDLGEPPAADED